MVSMLGQAAGVARGVARADDREWIYIDVRGCKHARKQGLQRDRVRRGQPDDFLEQSRHGHPSSRRKTHNV
jgi:hypothetical protein